MKYIGEVYPKGHDSISIWLLCVADGKSPYGWFIGMINKIDGEVVPDWNNGTSMMFWDEEEFKALSHDVMAWLTNKWSAIDVDNVFMRQFQHRQQERRLVVRTTSDRRKD